MNDVDRSRANDIDRVAPPALPPPPPVVISAAPFPQRSSVKKALMALERTFSILKPDVTRRNLTGAVNARI
jgi:nucleoside-diphosphate kinase